MDTKNSSYIKFFKYAFIIAATCIILCGVFMIAFSTRLYKNEEFKEIEAVSNLFISEIEDEFQINNTIYSDNIRNLHRNFGSSYGITFYVYDLDGNCVLCPLEEGHIPMSASLMQRLNKGSFLDFDASEISEKEQSILYGRRFSLQQGEDEPQSFYLAAYMPTRGIDTFTVKLIICFVIVCIICILPAYFALKSNAMKHADAAKEFLRVSEKYARGDFSETINISVPGNLQEISKYVNVIADNVKSSDETSKTFIANVSHELRTPITTIGGFVNGILDGTIPKSAHQEYLVLISKEIKRLSVLITSMLNMSRFEAGTLKPDFKDTNLTDIVIQTVLMFEKKINSKNLEVEGLDSDRLVAEVDPNLIQQVVYNLVENAVKFVNEGGTLSFSFGMEDNMCCVGIKNTGEGLKNNEIPHLFERFYKTDSSRGKDITGLGLGLAISRNIIRVNNGTITVKTRPGEYTEFIIKLPEKQQNN
ncbi:MAG: HAMP domain-containing histidine kinase [Ruminococcus sp.]|nr:HAMP domain-containing histidine kinase [Ruminococcus sp.]